MKIKRFGIITFCIGLPIAISLVFLREWFLQSRVVQNESMLRSLSIGVEIFRQEYGHYPSSLEQMKLNTHLDNNWRESMQHTLNAAQSNVWRDVYCYTSSTNGFTISVTGPDMAPAGWFGRQRKIMKSYRAGEALGKQ